MAMQDSVDHRVTRCDLAKIVQEIGREWGHLASATSRYGDCRYSSQSSSKSGDGRNCTCYGHATMFHTWSGRLSNLVIVCCVSTVHAASPKIYEIRLGLVCHSDYDP